MTAASFYGIRKKEGLGGVSAAIHSEGCFGEKPHPVSPVMRFRKVSSGSLSLLATALLFIACGGSTDPSSESLSTAADVQYVDPEGRYTISHPSDWTEHFDERGIPVLFAAPPAEPGDEFGDHVAISSNSLPTGVTLDQYVKRGLREVVGLGGEVRSHEATNLSGRQAYVDHLSFESDQGAWETLQWTVDADGEVFIITFTGEPGDRFDIWRPTAEGIARSFEVT